ncbi:MAG: flagellin lysine-N-methylase, partial [Selenomonadaceae bacterium]|nr:flagellin lysine-N-methylase [Selenomonadaceae bacterium]
GSQRPANRRVHDCQRFAVMEKKYLYFQPEYVGKFKCDGAKCNARCCKGWVIEIDKTTYEKYPPEVTKHIKFDSEQKKYFVTLKENKACPMLTENNLCRLQLEHGEDFLSVTCATYPRRTYNFGKFFERSLTLTCPVAAELILFQQEPMSFEFVEVPEKIHSGGGKIQIGQFLVREDYLELVLKIQVAMISILQTRHFSIDQRLIILGLFLDKLQELSSAQADKQTLLNLVATYESEKFLAKEMPPLIQNFPCNPENFILFMMKFIGYALPHLRLNDTRKFITTLEKVFEILPDESGLVSIKKAIINYENFADSRNVFLEKYSTFLENYLVNELFMNH